MKQADDPIVIFIIPLRSAKSAKSWATVCKLLERTIRSVCNQISLSFRILVICHEQPKLQRHYSHVEYVEVNFSAPTQPSSLTDRRLDKARKLWTGIHYSKNFNASYLMLLDADDCISNRLVEFVMKQSQSYGWYFSQGYQYKEGSRLIQYRKEKFEQFCGSCNIVQANLIYDCIKNIQFSDIQEDFLIHTQLPYILADRGTPLEALPFPGAIYITDNSQNSLNQAEIMCQVMAHNLQKLLQFYVLRLYKVMSSRLLTRSIRDEFSLHSID